MTEDDSWWAWELNQLNEFLEAFADSTAREIVNACGEFNALIIDAAPDLIGVHRCQSESAIPGAVLDTCTKNS